MEEQTTQMTEAINDLEMIRTSLAMLSLRSTLRAAKQKGNGIAPTNEY